MNKVGRIKFSLAVIFLIAILLLLQTGIGAVENTKTYDATTKTVTLTDPSNETVATIKLETPLDYRVIRGKDRKVAELTITNTQPQPQSQSKNKTNTYHK